MDNNEQRAIKDANGLLRAAIVALPEWMVYGGWDTPRCLWCKGFQCAGFGREPGHRKSCLRQRALFHKEMNELPLFHEQ